jgi:hypothetical protein
MARFTTGQRVATPADKLGTIRESVRIDGTWIYRVSHDGRADHETIGWAEWELQPVG